MKRLTLRSDFWLLCLLTSFVAAGCGRQDYEKRMDARLVQFRHQAKYRPLSVAPSELLPGSKELTIQLPAKLGTQMTLESKDPDDPSKDIDHRRLLPPFLPPLPGFIASYEQLTNDAKNNKLPYTMYVAAEKLTPVPEGAEKREPVETALLDQLHKELPDLPEGSAQWKDVPCSNPDPASPPVPGVAPTFNAILWRGLEVDCEQEFYAVLDGGAKEYTKLPGILKLFLYEYKEKDETRYFVLLGWRYPKQLVDDNKIPVEESADHLIGLMGGTIRVQPAQ
jgi:hypothetical protein